LTVYGERCALYDFIVAELKTRLSLCPRRMWRICRLLENQRDDLLEFARVLEQRVGASGGELPDGELARRVLGTPTRDQRDVRR
jgi:hypothetical protein